MKALIVITLALAMVGGYVYLSFNRRADRWNVCRSLGHGSAYCFVQGQW